MPVLRLFVFSLVMSVLSLGIAGCVDQPENGKAKSLLHVSYDVTRQLFKDVNERFIKEWKEKTGDTITINQSHGGSSSQAQSVANGNEADVVTLAVWPDLDVVRQAGLIPDDWERQLPNNASPYSSTVVFVVRKGNPKEIKDWADLVREGVQIITPNPKTSGNGKLSFLAAWGSVTTRGGSEDEAKAFVKSVYEHVPVLEAGGRSATVAFLNKQIGDVQLAWENEAWMEVEEGKGAVEIVYPKVSIRAQPHAALVTKNAGKHKTTELATAYLKFLYTPEIQKLFGKRNLRPFDEQVAKEFESKLAPITLFEVKDLVSGWDEAQTKFFVEGALYDQLYEKSK